MIFSIHDHKGRTQTFDGFNGMCTGNFKQPPVDAKFLAILQDEDTFSSWWVQDECDSIEELKRMFRLVSGTDERISIRLVPVGKML